MQDRKDEIAAKRAKLAEVRRQRELRQKELSNTRQSLGDSKELPGSLASHAENRKEVDTLISRLLGENRPTGSPSTSPARSTRLSGPPISGSPIGSKRESNNASPAGPRSPSNGYDSVPEIHTAQPAAVTYSDSQTQTQSSGVLETATAAAPRPAREVITYSTGVQTEGLWPPPSGVDSLSQDHRSDGYSSTVGKRESRLQREQREEQLRQEVRRELERELKDHRSTLHDAVPGGDISDSRQDRALTAAELKTLTSTARFESFVEKSSKVIERALEQDYDLLADYSLGDETYAQSEEDRHDPRALRQLMQFYDDRWSRRRMISDIDFSPMFPELCLASYTKNSTAPHDPDGLVQLWNAHLCSRAEYVFHAQADILTAKFSPFHPNLVFGACYSGQVLLWDTRAKATAVQRTGLSGSGHTHPVYSMSVVGTHNAHSIFTASTDGVCCSWSVDMLSQPQEYLELTTPPPSRTEELSPTCMSFAQSDPTHFLVGTEHGAIFPCNRYDRAGAKAGTDSRLVYQGHTAPVMSLQHHPNQTQGDLSDLVLSTSLDWSFKVWQTRTPTNMGNKSAAAAQGTGQYSEMRMPQATVIEPLIDIPRDDIVYDAAWSPVRPGVFALVDGAGLVEVWNLAEDLELPASRVQPNDQFEDMVAGLILQRQRSLNKICWEPTDGRRIAVGGVDGKVTLIDTGSVLGGKEGVRIEDWTYMRRLIDDLSKMADKEP